jgi:glutaredoxin 3
MDIIIYTTQTCMYCNLAKKLLKEKELSFKEINIETDINIFKNLIIKTKQKTVPQIFINENFIGGYTELCKYLKTEK